MKNKILIISIIIVLVIAITLIFFLFIKKDKPLEDPKKDLEINLKQMGEQYYNSFYKGLVGSGNVNILEAYVELGIKVNINGLEVFYESDEEALNNLKSFSDCDKVETRVIIYPKAPFGESDYSVDTTIECGT